MAKSLQILVWSAVSLLGALALGTIALHRGEEINAMWLVVAAICAYALGYRFYSKFVSAKVLAAGGSYETSRYDETNVPGDAPHDSGRSVGKLGR